MKILGILFTMLVCPLTLFAQDVLPEVVPTKITTTYIPQGFDSNDKAQLAIEGSFSNTCYKVGPYQLKVDPITSSILILQTAYKYKGLCMMIPVKYTNVIDLGILGFAPEFTVKDVTDGAVLGKMPLKIANKAEADDYLYAPVTEASVNVRNRTVTVSGSFSNNCIVFKDLKVARESHNVVIALPITEVNYRLPCKDEAVPFIKTVNLPFLNEGRYLLHVRALNGQAVNKIFEIGGGDIR